MTDSRFIKKIKLKNILSFGSDGMELELRPAQCTYWSQRLRQIKLDRGDFSAQSCANSNVRADLKKWILCGVVVQRRR